MRSFSIAPKFTRLEVVTARSFRAFKVEVKNLGEIVNLLKWKTPQEAEANGMQEVIHQALVAIAQSHHEHEDIEEMKWAARDPWWGVEFHAEVPGFKLSLAMGLQASPSIHVTLSTAGVEILRYAVNDLRDLANRLHAELDAVSANGEKS